MTGTRFYLAGSTLGEGAPTVEDVQRATFNILEDFASEKDRLDDVRRASLNLLEDFASEKRRLEHAQWATLNILDDFADEKRNLESMHQASINILEDFDGEKRQLQDAQRATLNILEDFDVERVNAIKLSQRLEAVNKDMEAFAYSVSHDLRAPLRAIDGFSQILLTDYAEALADKPRHYLQLVCDNARQMGRLIDDILRLSRLGRQSVMLQRINPLLLVNECLEELQGERSGRSVTIQIGELPPCWGDAGLLKQAWFNLLSNAQKYTRKREVAHIEIGSACRNGETTYFVKDNGVGFDMQYADKLFGVFQRLHSMNEYEGTGIGLALTKRIVTRHGGCIWAESKVNEGAAFYFTLARRPKDD